MAFLLVIEGDEHRAQALAKRFDVPITLLGTCGFFYTLASSPDARENAVKQWARTVDGAGSIISLWRHFTPHHEAPSCEEKCAECGHIVKLPPA